MIYSLLLVSLLRMCEFIRAAVTKYTVWVFLHTSSPRSRGRQHCFLLMPFLLACDGCHLLVFSPGLSLVCGHVQISCSYKDTSNIELRPIYVTLFCLNYLFKGPISKYSHTLRSWASTYTFFWRGGGEGSGSNTSHKRINYF